MTVSKVLVNDTVRIKVKFVDTDPVTLEQTEVSPVSVSVVVLDSEGTQVTSASATQITSSEYYYNFSTSNAGEYTIKFTGTLANNTSITVSQQLYVSSITEEYKPSITLRSEETITFAPDIDPLYLDPEEILSIFPEASLLEIGELIYNYSNEVKEMYSIQDSNTNPDLPFTVLEYIKASACCELSRTYGFGGDDEMSLKLADLEITNRSAPRDVATRSNATTWCQIAASLRREILAKKVYIRGVQPKNLPNKKTFTSGKTLDPQTGKLVYLSDKELYGPGRRTPTDPDDPMPDRGFRQYD
jgi:hypothetical protein